MTRTGNDDKMRLIAFLLLFTGTGVAQSPDEWLPRATWQWTQEPDGFGGLKFGASQAAVKKQFPLEPTGIDSRNIGTASSTQLKVWGVDFYVKMLFLSDRLSLISVGYPGQEFANVKAKLIELLGPVHKAHELLTGTVKAEDLFWYDSQVFVRLSDDERSHSHGFFLATYEYMKDYGGGAAMMRLPEPPVWVPFPANHWPQEPLSFNGMAFNATRAETEKVIKLKNCQAVVDNPIQKGITSCDASLNVAGKAFQGQVLFGDKAYRDKFLLRPQDAPGDEDRLVRITANFNPAEYAFVKAAFVKTYGQPHQSYPNLSVVWQGNKVSISLVKNQDGTARLQLLPAMRPMMGIVGIKSVR